MTPLPLAAAALAALLPLAPALSTVPTCTDRDSWEKLDFWVGEWTVHVGEQQVGTNSISKTLGDCAVVERWTAAGGGEGMSLFWVHPPTGLWKQVWVTGTPMQPGGTKEKAEVTDFEGPGIRFRGLVEDTQGRSWHDRTTLTPMEDGSVRQHIEISTDGGESWRTTFDAIYRRR